MRSRYLRGYLLCSPRGYGLDFKHASALVTAIAVAGCSAGNAIPQIDRIPPVAQSLAVQPAVATAWMAMHLAIPRKPYLDPSWGYVSPAAKSVDLEIDPRNGSLFQFRADVLPTSPHCHPTVQATICDFDRIVVPRGRATATLSFLDGTIATKGITRAATVSYGVKQIAIRKTKNAPLVVYMNGVYTRFLATVPTTVLPAGKVTSLNLSIATFDAGGFRIPSPSTYYSRAYQMSPRLHLERASRKRT